MPRPSRVPSEVQLRYNYQKGDSGRVIRKAVLDAKLNLSNGQTFPMGNKMGLNCVEEVLAVENGRPVLEVRKIISEYVMMQTDPQTGQNPDRFRRSKSRSPSRSIAGAIRPRSRPSAEKLPRN